MDLEFVNGSDTKAVGKGLGTYSKLYNEKDSIFKDIVCKDRFIEFCGDRTIINLDLVETLQYLENDIAHIVLEAEISFSNGDFEIFKVKDGVADKSYVQDFRQM